ncbi:MAG: lipopolysaccharide kinase InaA family protein [Gammaproteobacteria bacterium]
MPASSLTIPGDFLGINVAPSDDPQCDDYIIARLAELKINQVRMDYSYSSIDGDAERLLRRLLADGKQVLLNVFPPAAETRKLADDSDCATRWHTFLSRVFTEFAGRAVEFEIGNTPNRGKWSGSGMKQFARLWQIGSQVAAHHQVAIAGPNISDFEPLYSLAYLLQMERVGLSPAIHTDNLFVERTVEPEAFDHRVLGGWLRKPLAFNLIKKARVIEAIGQRISGANAYCTYTCWTNKRLARKANPEQKKVDYLVRYCLLAATSNALGRVYWGPLICGRDGIIHCGNEEYPRIDNVAFHEKIRGSLADFRISPAFHALGHLATLLPGSECLQAVSQEQGLSHLVLVNGGQETHVVWCRDGKSCPLNTLYPGDQLDAARFTNALGEPLDYPPEVISEQPLFIRFAATDQPVSRPTVSTIEAAMVNDDLWAVIPGHQALAVNHPSWQGAISVAEGASLSDSIQALLPEQLLSLPINRLLRDKRNKLWTLDNPLDPGDSQLVVKLNRALGGKRLTYRFTDSKGKRHWDNANYMLRCGVHTPQPVAYFERRQHGGIADNFYLSHYLENAFSARDIFTAFQQGADGYNGFSKEFLLDRIAAFIYWMHDQRIVHRDLSSGNLLFEKTADGDLKPYVIDIGRARIHPEKRLSSAEIFIDLARICYKLNWTDRNRFIDHYNRHYFARGKRRLPSWWRYPLYRYELKQKLKKRIKALFRRKAP